MVKINAGLSKINFYPKKKVDNSSTNVKKDEIINQSYNELFLLQNKIKQKDLTVGQIFGVLNYVEHFQINDKNLHNKPVLKNTLKDMKTSINDLYDFEPKRYLMPVLREYKTKGLELKYYKQDECRNIIVLTKEQRSNCKLVAKVGNFYFKDSIFPADSINVSKDEDKSLNYVMSKNGDFFAHRGYKNQFHHSSFFGKGKVACAGEIVLRNGKVISINNKSGHFRPEPIHLFQAIVALYSMGVLPDDCVITLHKIKSFYARDLLSKVDLIKSNQDILDFLGGLKEAGC